MLTVTFMVVFILVNYFKYDLNVKIFNFLGATPNDRTVVKNPEWCRNHNFRGVYDMTLDEVILNSGF